MDGGDDLGVMEWERRWSTMILAARVVFAGGLGEGGQVKRLEEGDLGIILAGEECKEGLGVHLNGVAGLGNWRWGK